MPLPVYGEDPKRGSRPKIWLTKTAAGPRTPLWVETHLGCIKVPQPRELILLYLFLQLLRPAVQKLYNPLPRGPRRTTRGSNLQIKVHTLMGFKPK